MFVCLCKGVTDRTIRAEVARGACSPEEIAACTGAGTRCGSCRHEVAAIVEQEVAGRRSLPMCDDAAAA
jgi:bacterioferritin-associated ferredoxin